MQQGSNASSPRRSGASTGTRRKLSGPSVDVSTVHAISLNGAAEQTVTSPEARRASKRGPRRSGAKRGSRRNSGQTMAQAFGSFHATLPGAIDNILSTLGEPLTFVATQRPSIVAASQKRPSAAGGIGADSSLAPTGLAVNTRQPEAVQPQLMTPMNALQLSPVAPDSPDKRKGGIRVRSFQSMESELADIARGGLGVTLHTGSSDSQAEPAIQVTSPTSASSTVATIDPSVDTALQVTDVDELRSHLLRVDEWDFDIFTVARLSCDRPLTVVMSTLMDAHCLFQQLDIDKGDFSKLIFLVEHGYRPVKYHNRVHAADVVQALNYFITKSFFVPYLKPLETMSALFAAAIHDFKHPGTHSHMYPCLATHG